MKIGYICNQGTCVSGASNGIRMQALIWCDELIKQGHEVVLINSWGTYDWTTFDLVHAFGFADSISFVQEMKKRNVPVVCSPIIDTVQSKSLYKLATLLGSETLRINSPGYYLRKKEKYIDLFFARSKFEASYLNECFDIPLDKIAIIPLSYKQYDKELLCPNKENFCFHVSSLTQGRKNVMRLIKAAIKYKFNLVLAGSTNPQSAFKPLKKLIDENENITCLGFISDEQLEDLYSKAKVFALPSLNEGVGLVALDAAAHGCDIVITNVGGPKEYYPDEMALKVNPYSIDEIGQAVVKLMSESRQPELSMYIKANYKVEKCVGKLIDEYNKIVKR